jgi:hypothetical protein
MVHLELLLILPLLADNIIPRFFFSGNGCRIRS